MRIYLKEDFLNYLTDDNFEFSLLTYESKINQLLNELSKNTNSNYLISGYRGVGKSTFIKLLNRGLERINDEKIEKLLPGEIDKNTSLNLLININLGSYNSYTNLLRKLVRTIYLEIENLIKNNDPIVEIIIRDGEKDLLEEMKLLYDKTFFDIQKNSVSAKKNEKIIVFNMTFDFKKLIVVFLPLLITLISWVYNLSSYINSYPEFSLLISSLWAVLAGLGVNYKQDKTIIKNEELIRNSLYDDEIAEYKLIDLLRKIKEQKLNITFAFDEIDKMSENQVVSFFSEVKPLMLSNNANFLFVTGQQVYYEYEFSQTMDDPLITSLFSKTIHVELASKELFEKILNQILNLEKTTVPREVIKNYLHYKVFESDRVLRKFINLIRQDILYNNEGVPYINLQNYQLGVLSSGAKILKVIETIESDFFETGKHSEGIKDFFDMQLYIAVKKAKKYIGVEFQSADLINIEDYKKDKYLLNLIFEVQSLIDALLEELNEKKILQKKEKVDQDGLKQIFYRWRDQRNIVINQNEKGINLDEEVNKILEAHLSNDEFEALVNKEINKKIAKLDELNLINSRDYKNLINNYTKYHSNENLDNNQKYLNDLLKSKTTFNSFIYQIYENTVYNLLTDIIDPTKYLLHKNGFNKEENNTYNHGPDFIIEKISNKKIMIFEVKVFSNKNSIKRLLNDVLNKGINIWGNKFNRDSIVSVEFIIFGDFDNDEIERSLEYFSNRNEDNLINLNFYSQSNLVYLREKIIGNTNKFEDI